MPCRAPVRQSAPDPSFGITSVGRDGDLKANPSYWGGKPPLAGLVFKVVPDAMVRVLEFKKGSFGFMQNDLWNPTCSPGSSTTPTRTSSPSRHNVSVHRHQPQSTPFSCTRRYAKRCHAIDRESIIRHLIKISELRQRPAFAAELGAYEGTVNHGLTIRRRRNTCWMRLDPRSRRVTGRDLGSSSLSKARISICEEELPKALKRTVAARRIELEIRT